MSLLTLSDKKCQHLALCLLDAVEDENLIVVNLLLNKYNANPSTIITEKGIAAIHYSAGMENIPLAEKITKIFLAHNADPNLKTIDEEITPLHIAAFYGRKNIVKMLLEKGGDINIPDSENKTPLLYAVTKCHFDVIEVFQNFIFEKKIETKKATIIESKNASSDIFSPKAQNNLIKVEKLEENKFTPNRINYNFDVTSPYYINITHRRKDKCANKNKVNAAIFTENSIKDNTDEAILQKNLFELTKSNLDEFTKSISISTDSRKSIIYSWRDKVYTARNRASLIDKLEEIDKFLTDFDETVASDKIIETDTLKPLPTLPTVNVIPTNHHPKFEFNDQRIEIIDICSATENSFVTAEDNVIDESKFIRSPKREDCIIQLLEEYEHKDRDYGLRFIEMKFCSNPIESQHKRATADLLNRSQSSISTDFTVPLDYDSEALRAELTNFGMPPGPITKSTKRLYVKKLIKYKRDPERALIEQNAKEKCKPSFSVELERTLRDNSWHENLLNFFELEKQMIQHFQQPAKKWREGHLKTSFIYLLIDPRISTNLPGIAKSLSKQQTWSQFLSAIFYVGKGKNSRPYSHLYDAMKYFANYDEVGLCATLIDDQRFQLLPPPGLKQRQMSESKKLQRIIDIWLNGNGVVCLHIYHNIMPVEAYTREAAIIDCLGLQHLTNAKRGDYYGAPQSWSMKSRKFLGIALLFKAMQIYLAEGESQLMPGDLI